jgi:putative ABC transport system permease protein
LKVSEWTLVGSPGTLTGVGQADRIRYQEVSNNLLRVLHVKPALGRDFLATEGGYNDRAVMPSHRCWERRFGSDPAVIGKTVLINGKPYVVAGIMPSGFNVFFGDPDFFMAVDPRIPAWVKRTDHWLLPIARLKPGISIERAQKDMDLITARLAQAYPEANKDSGAKVERIEEMFSGGTQAFHPLIAAVGFVLLVACANVANLLLARLGSRGKELTIRASLGAGRLRIIRLLFAESLVLSLLGGALGTLIASWGVDLIRVLNPNSLEGLEVKTADWRVLLFTLSLSVITAVLFGILPAAHAAKLDLNASLKEGGRGLGSPGRRTRNALVVMETALAVLLLTGAGLMISTVVRLRSTDIGIDPGNLLTMEFTLGGVKYVTISPTEDVKTLSPQVSEFYKQLLDRVRTLPGVQSAAIGVVPGRWMDNRSFTISGRPSPEEGMRPSAAYTEADSVYFTTLRIPLKKGRYLDERDTRSTSWVAVINEGFARRQFAGEDPIGRFLRLRMDPQGVVEDQPREIVGVVGNVRAFGPASSPPPSIYVSYLQQPDKYPGGRGLTHLRKNLIIRTSGKVDKSAAALTAAVKKIAADLDKDQVVDRVEPMDKVLGETLGYWTFYFHLLGSLAAIALVLAAIGIYGVSAYNVTERTHEIGVRMALGAGRSEILRMVIRRAALLTSLGLACGIAAALALTRVMARMVFGVKPADALTFAAVAVVLAAVSVMASYFPARRAANLDPLTALRYE